MRIPGVVALVVLAGAFTSAQAQNTPPLSGCEAPPEVRAVFDTTLSPDSLARLKVKERGALVKRVIDDLLAKYPREYTVYEKNLPQSFAEEGTPEFDSLRNRWIKNAREHPEDPLALMLASKVLIGKDTPEAIRLLEAAKAKAPEFPWPVHELAALYERGKYADQAKMKENLEKFYSLCPAWTSGSFLESFYLQTDLPLMARTAVALRARLEKETDPRRLQDYQTLWQREFLTRPPSEHEALRVQIRQDLKRIEQLVPNGDAAWRSFLIGGYRLSGASNEELARMQDAAVRAFPHSDLAVSSLWSQWNKQHPQPDGQKDAEAWKSYDAAYIEMLKKVIRDFPEYLSGQRSDFLMGVLRAEYVTKEDALAALDRYQQALEDYGGAGMILLMPTDPPRFLLDHGWEPERALELLRKTATYAGGGHMKTAWGDSLADDDLKRLKDLNEYEDRVTLGLILKAATLAGKPEEALKFRAVIEGPPPTDPRSLEQYWTNRARFAVLDKHPQDALAYYRLALDSRTRPPEYYHGILRDNLMTEFHDLWTAQGGTEAAWAAWNPPAEKPETSKESAAAQNTVAKDMPPADKGKAAADKKKVQESDWEQVTAKMPAFELSDFAGKTWRQRDLQGKVVLIVSWATWCAPCRQQDKLLQKFYDKVKGREDLAVLSFNVDENPGRVLPFMQSMEYSFPVLAAFSYKDAKDLVPRTWIIDRQGNWRWVKNGYDESKTYAEFEKDLLDRIEKARAL